MKIKLYFLMTIFLFLSASAHAGLGEKVSVIAKDQNRLHLQKHEEQSFAHFTVHQISTPAMTIKEYANAEGLVFALTWKGHRAPDLNALLGPYQQECVTAAQTTPRHPGLHRFGVLRSKNVIIERVSRLRSARGRAMVPALIPAGVNLNEIQ
jgi:hypothetical protein